MRSAQQYLGDRAVGIFLGIYQIMSFPALNCPNVIEVFLRILIAATLRNFNLEMALAKAEDIGLY
jgi:hypothetical protein